MKRLLFILAVMTVMTTTFAQKKSLVLYYSETGTTEAVALEIQKQTGADYQFIVTGRGMDGREATSTIYVTVGNGEGAVPEFTQVVR